MVSYLLEVELWRCSCTMQRCCTAESMASLPSVLDSSLDTSVKDSYYQLLIYTWVYMYRYFEQHWSSLWLRRDEILISEIDPAKQNCSSKAKLLQRLVSSIYQNQLVLTRCVIAKLRRTIHLGLNTLLYLMLYNLNNERTCWGNLIPSRCTK
jgi:hypothetical protein